jgi:hypothetical protein
VTRSSSAADQDNQDVGNTLHGTGPFEGPSILTSSFDVQAPRLATTGSNLNTSCTGRLLFNNGAANQSPAGEWARECEILPTYPSHNNPSQSSPTDLDAVSATLDGHVPPSHSLGGTGSAQAQASSGNEPACTIPTSLNTLAPALDLGLVPPLPAGLQKPVSGDELHGPNSYLSVCADPGVRWIESRIGISNFDTCAAEMVSGVSQKLKLHKRLNTERFPEPSEQTARLLTKAYFEESFEATFQTVDQQNFEARLEEQYKCASQDDDPAWYALRNIVFAFGCRIVSFKSHSWTEAQESSRGYFENSLSVEPDLLHGPSRMVAIQALLVMVSVHLHTSTQVNTRTNIKLHVPRHILKKFRRCSQKDLAVPN